MIKYDDIKNALGDDYKESDDILIGQLLDYVKIYNKTVNDVKEEGYRRPVANLEDGIRNPQNARYTINNAFTAMNECSKQIRQIIEILGLGKKGKKIELSTKDVNNLPTLLKQLNDISDE